MERTSVPHTAYPNGLRVRVRLPRPSDHALLADLARRTDQPADPTSIARLLRFDPRRRTVLCAGVWLGSQKVLAGYAAADRSPMGRPVAPDVLLTDEELVPGVSALLLDLLAATTTERFAA